MRLKSLLIVLIPVCALMLIPFVQGATMTECDFDQDTYNPGDTGYVSITIYNDKSDTIRITELTATVNYYYDDESVYTQKFYTNMELPVEIQPEDSSSLTISFSLPTNIAPGYPNVVVKVVTDVWNTQSEIWFSSEHLTDQPLLYIESPYKEQLDEQVTINDQLEEQITEQVTINNQLEGQIADQQAINKNTINMMYLFGGTTAVFAAVAVIVFVVSRRTQLTNQSFF